MRQTERERERERERESERERARERGAQYCQLHAVFVYERVRDCACVCVAV